MDATTVVARKENSFYFHQCAKISFQLPGIAVEGATRLLTPFPLLLLVSAFKLSGWYSSQTTPTQLACCVWDTMYDRNTCDA